MLSNLSSRSVSFSSSALSSSSSSPSITSSSTKSKTHVHLHHLHHPHPRIFSILLAVCIVAYTTYSYTLFPHSAGHGNARNGYSSLIYTSSVPRQEQPKYPQQQQQHGQDLPEGFRYCTAPRIQDTKSSSKDNRLDMWYQCQGDVYEQVTAQIHQLAQNHIVTRARPITWGHRPTALPANTTVLFWGNSHLRQVAKTAACQYAEQIIRVHHHGDDFDAHMMHQIDFHNGATMYIVANSYVAYARQEFWPQLLAQQMQLPHGSLDSIQAIVQGQFNPCYDKYSSFSQHMMQIIQGQPQPQQLERNNTTNNKSNADVFECTADAIGPSLAETLQVFSSTKTKENHGNDEKYDRAANTANIPILFVPMFSSSQVAHVQKVMKAIEIYNQRHQNNNTTTTPMISSVDGRQYINMIGHECGGNSRTGSPSECFDRQGMHRCTGPHGGHVDPVAWDVLELLWKTT